jgi:chaperonin GroEL (HSP60 family)
MSHVATTEGVPVILLKEGTRQSRGKDAQRNNIRAAKLIAEIIQTSHGPREMDKLLVDSIVLSRIIF